MPQALITVNGAAGSNTDLPINVLVTLNNTNIGGETTYNWTILDQPPGAADALSAATGVPVTFTPRKEGSYLVRLVVNQGQASEVANQVVCAVRQLKTRERVPAAGETTEAGAATGWATSQNSLLRLVDTMRADPGIVVGVAGAAGLNRGDVLRITSTALIKTGLPGEERVPSFTRVASLTRTVIDEPLGVLEGGVDGSATPANGAVIRVRVFGLFGPLTGAPAVGDSVYVTAAGALTVAAGIWPPTTPFYYLGHVASVDAGAGTYFAWLGAFPFVNEFSTRLLAVEQDTAIMDATATDRRITRRDGTGRLIVGTDVASALRLRANSTDYWDVLTTGELRAVGGTRQIQQVASPTAGDHAATRAWVEGNALPAWSPVGATSLPVPGAGTTTYVLTPFFAASRTAAFHLRAPATGQLATALYGHAEAGPGAGQTITLRVRNVTAATSKTLPLTGAGEVSNSIGGVPLAVTAGDLIQFECDVPSTATATPTDVSLSYTFVGALVPPP